MTDQPHAPVRLSDQDYSDLEFDPDATQEALERLRSPVAASKHESEEPSDG